MATKALKYMLMSKVIADWLHGVTFFNPAQVMLNLPDEVTNLVSGKLALRCLGSLLTPDLLIPPPPGGSWRLLEAPPHHCNSLVVPLTSTALHLSRF